MTKDKAKAAIVGFGHQGKRIGSDLLELWDLVEVTALCDVNPNAREAPAHRQKWESFAYPPTVDFGERKPTFYTDWREMVSAEEIDLLMVVTWTKDHAPIVVEAANHGVKAIWCEKPITDSLQAAREMIDACKASGTTLAVNHSRRIWDGHILMREAIQNSEIGELRHLWISCGGARLGDLAIHFVDWAMWFADSPAMQVTGWLDPVDEPNPRDQEQKHGFKDPPGAIHLRLENGVRAYIDLSRNLAIPLIFEIVGTRGRACIEEMEGKYNRWEIRRRPEKRSLAGTIDYYGKLVRNRKLKPPSKIIDWGSPITKGVPLLLEGKSFCDGEEAYRALEVLVAAHLSDEWDHASADLPIRNSRVALDRILPIA